MKLNEFLSRHTVFTLDELERFLSRRGTANLNTRKSLLTYYRNKGRIIPVRRGLYATVPLGADPDSYPVDPYLVAAKMTEDAVLGYHTALEFYGKAYTVFSRLFYISEWQPRPVKLQYHEIRGVKAASSLVAKGLQMFGVAVHNRSGVQIRVTNFDRTLVDMLDRPDLAGSWEEIWRSLESVEFFDLDRVVEYALLLDNATTAAKVGFFLEQHRDTLMVEDAHLEPLRKRRPKQPHYIVSGKRNGCQWVKDWNLMVPAQILNRSWGEAP